MRALPILIGAMAGVVLGWAGSRLLVRSDLEERSGEVPRSKSGPESDAVWRWIRARDDLPELRSREEFLRAREASRSEAGRSPYRGEAREVAWLAELPLEALIALLEAGELDGAESISMAMARWAEADPEAALAALDRLSLTRDGMRFAQGAVYAHWARTDPLGLLARLEGGEPSLEREQKARLLLAAWKAENPRQALGSLERLSGLFAHPGETLARMREELLTAWLERDEEAAFAWVEEIGDDRERAGLLDTLVMARLSRDGARAAVDYILSRPDEAGWQDRLANYWREWAASAPSEALARLGALPEDHRFWNHEAAAVAQRAMVMAILREDTEEAVAAVGRLPEGMRRRQILLGMIQAAASNDLVLGRELLQRLPESREREQAASFLVELWARDDLAAAGEWLHGQEPTASRDVATSRFAMTLAGDDAALAAQWADAIVGEDLRDQTRESLFARWREMDAEAAEAWRDSWE